MPGVSGMQHNHCYVSEQGRAGSKKDRWRQMAGAWYYYKQKRREMQVSLVTVWGFARCERAPPFYPITFICGKNGENELKIAEAASDLRLARHHCLPAFFLLPPLYSPVCAAILRLQPWSPPLGVLPHIAFIPPPRNGAIGGICLRGSSRWFEMPLKHLAREH